MNLNFSEAVLLNSFKLRDKYMRIRYEDFVLNPLGKTLKIYEFVGIEMTMNIKHWLDTAMSVTNEKNLSKTSPMGLKRNVMSVLNTWRAESSFEDVLTMQRNCEWVLDKLGYKIFRTEKELRDLDELHFAPNW